MREFHPWPLVKISPQTAEEYGISEGEWIWIENTEGRCKQMAHIDPVIDPHYIHAEHGWWFPEQDGEAPNLFGVFDANANNLIPHESVGVTGYGAPYKNGICSITRVDSMKD